MGIRHRRLSEPIQPLELDVLRSKVFLAWRNGRAYLVAVDHIVKVADIRNRDNVGGKLEIRVGYVVWYMRFFRGSFSTVCAGAQSYRLPAYA